LQQTAGQNNTDCDGTLQGNAGCGITEWSHSSYGPYFDSQGGGVFAMKWDDEGIAVYSFYRAAVPEDIVQGSPDPTNWGAPDGALDPSGCNPITFFVNHSIIFGTSQFAASPAYFYLRGGVRYHLLWRLGW
jgi:hypothetical protein